MIVGYDHVQVAIPAGGEDAARAFYGGVLGMREIPKPAALAARGGCWFSSGAAVLHLGVESPFVPARKAHPAFLVSSIDSLTSAFPDAEWDESIPGVRRFHVFDPFGNRLEFQQAGSAER